MPGIYDKQPIPIPCANCGKKTRKTIGWLKAHSHYTCTCGAEVRLNTEELRRKVAEIDDFLRKNFGVE